ncbi:ABC transporter permease [Corynebacterium amycolatum]|uniref:ABC transporter permease n=1 Tax=Corynebacterium amycolatum TaxID=43765 RepID=UPI0021165E3F|nr:ABC transporter permease [Corynebacterium amycolatum]
MSAEIARWLIFRLVIRGGLLFAVLGLVFVAIDRLPGNAASAILGANRTPEALLALERNLSLDKPLTTRFLSWLGSAFAGDFGTSVNGVPIISLLCSALPVTLATTGMAFLVTAVLSVVIAIFWVSHAEESWISRVIDRSTVALIALPEFVIGVFLVAVFSLWLGWFPAVTITAGGLPTQVSMYALPVLALIVPQVAWNSRMLSASFEDASHNAAIINAKLNGIVGYRLALRHILPISAPIFATSMATTAGVLVAGTVTVEALFNHPGMGLLVANAVAQRDISVILAVLAVTGAIILALLTAADAIKIAFTPKVQL